MTVSLTGFFVTIPCPVPVTFVQACRKPFTPEEAIGFLQGAKDYLVKQTRIEVETKIIAAAPLAKRVLRDVDLNVAKIRKNNRSIELRRACAEQTIAKITERVERKIAELTKMIGQRCESSLFLSSESWLTYQLVRAFKKLAENHAAVYFLCRVGVVFPETITKENAISLLDEIIEKCDDKNPFDFVAKDAVKGCFFAAIAEEMPEAMLKGIQDISRMPAVLEAIHQAEITIPAPITRENVALLLHAIDDRCDKGDEAAQRLETTVKPYLDSVLETALLGWTRKE